MSLQLYTAKMGWRGPGALPVTRYIVNDALGVRFAPSKSLLDKYLCIRKAGLETDETWAEYELAYTKEMRALYKLDQGPFCTLLAYPEATLLCFCENPERCHRTVLARLLVKLGATYHGERS